MTRWIAAALAAGLGLALPAASPPTAGGYAGRLQDPHRDVRNLHPDARHVKTSRILNDRQILFEMAGGEAWLN